MTRKEMQLPNEPELTAEQIASLDREAEYWHAYYQAQDEVEKWYCELHDKAQAFFPQLEKHLPPQVWQQMLEVFETHYGAQCIAEALRGRSGCTEKEDDLPF
jgi:hypothetical protein